MHLLWERSIKEGTGEPLPKEWQIPKEWQNLRCPACEKYRIIVYKYWSHLNYYCPFCGAKMRKEE